MTTQMNQFPAKVEEFFTHKRRINLKSGNKSVLTDNIMCNQEENKTLRHNKIFESINSINQVIHSTLDFDEIMNKTIKEASKTIECDTVVVALKKDEHWKISYTYGYQENLIGIEINEREQPHIFLAIKTKKPSAIKYELVDRDYLKKCNVHSIIVVPLVTNDEGFGVIFFNYQTSTLVFDDIEIYFATQFASSISLVLRNSRLVENLYKEICERKIIELELKKAYENQERKAELEKAYMSLIESEKNLAEAQEMAHIGNWSRNIKTGEIYWSDEVYRIFGFKPQEFGVTYDAFLSRVHPDDRDYIINTVGQSSKGNFFDIEYRIARTDGLERIVHEKVKVIFDTENIPIRLSGTIQDITENKKSEDFLKKIETARKKETHHRIKNNLQVISSILDLEAEKFRNKRNILDSEVIEAFRESQDRVISIALIHEKLYKSEGLDEINFSSYIEELTNNLFLIYKHKNTDVSLNIDLEMNLFFDLDVAVPLGMIINELISNSFKYAFPGGSKGEIRIKLCREEKGECKTEGCKRNFILFVSDNGVGVPKNLNVEDLESMGLQLVTSLVDQLEGKLELKRDNGTEFTIRFTIKEKKIINSAGNITIN